MRVGVPVGCLQWVDEDSVHVVRSRGRGRGQSFGKTVCAGVSAKLFWLAIYCAKPRPDTESQSGSRSRRVMERRAQHIMWEYNLTAAIEIWPLTQPHTYEIGSSGFSAISRIKFAITTRAYFTSMPYTDKKNIVKCFHFSWKFLPCLSLFYFSQWARIFPIGSFLWVSTYEYPNMTSILASF